MECDHRKWDWDYIKTLTEIMTVRGCGTEWGFRWVVGDEVLSRGWSPVLELHHTATVTQHYIYWPALSPGRCTLCPSPSLRWRTWELPPGGCLWHHLHQCPRRLSHCRSRNLSVKQINGRNITSSHLHKETRQHRSSHLCCGGSITSLSSLARCTSHIPPPLPFWLG